MKKWRWWVLLLIVATATYAIAVEPFRLTVTRYQVHVTQWPAPRPPLTIAILGDIHVAKPWMTPNRLAAIVERTNALKPDIILLTGDYVGTHPLMQAVPPAEGVAPLAKLQAPCGVFAVLGNHDLDRRAPGWAEALRAAPLTLLENDRRTITCHGLPLAVAGVADQMRQQPDLALALQGTEEIPTLLMMHEPDLFPIVPAHVALTVAGHTHGGQVAPPLIGPLVVPSKFGTHYARGVYFEAGRTLVVSSGLGMSILPIRFGVPPEITMVKLASRKAQKARVAP
jgi:uncharacterized protein